MMFRALFLGAVIAVGIATAPVAYAALSITTPTTSFSVYYKNCAEACAAGVAPLHRGDPGYRPGLDRDGDGIACEVCP